MELEHRSTELKSSLFKERDQRQMLQLDLDASNAALLLSGYPTTELLELIAKRDGDLGRCHRTIKELQSEVKELRRVESLLRRDLDQAQHLQKEVQTIRNLIAGTSSGGSLGRRVQFSPCALKEGTPTYSFSTSTPRPDERESESPQTPHHQSIHLKKPLTFTKVTNTRSVGE
jgi:hypothetical protein